MIDRIGQRFLNRLRLSFIYSRRQYILAMRRQSLCDTHNLRRRLALPENYFRHSVP